MIFKSYKRQLREKSLIKYKGLPPSIEKVKEIISQSKLSRAAFELTYGIVDKTLFWYIRGERNLPAIYWHIFYEFDNLEKFYANFNVRVKREKKKEEKKERPVIAETNKSILDAYRERFNK